MIDKEYLKKLAGKLMFDMDDSEYETLQKEFEITLKNMDKIAKIEGLKDVKPMTFPYITYQVKARKDTVKEENELSVDEVLRNAKHTLNDQVKVPKVVDE